MTVKLVAGAGEVWDSITAVCKRGKRRRAAVAYVGQHAPQLLPLGRGDILVVNAGDSALLSHATSPVALKAYLNAGVKIFSSPRVHAKMVVTAGEAVIGSANASASSTALEEAALITDDLAVVAAGRAFIDGLPGLTEVNDAFVAAAQATWARGGRSGPPGTDGGIPDPGFLPPWPFRLHLADTVFSTMSETEERAFRQASRRVRRAAGPAATYRIASYRLPREDPPYRCGDVLIQVYDDGGERWVAPPAVVFSDATRVSRRWNLHLLRERVDLRPIALGDAQAQLREMGVDGRLGSQRWIRSPAVRDALLRLWGLSVAS
jgi:hypothetical protein